MKGLSAEGAGRKAEVSREFGEYGVGGEKGMVGELAEELERWDVMEALRRAVAGKFSRMGERVSGSNVEETKDVETPSRPRPVAAVEAVGSATRSSGGGVGVRGGMGSGIEDAMIGSGTPGERSGSGQRTMTRMELITRCVITSVATVA